MKRLQVVFGEMTLEKALASFLKPYTYSYDPLTISPAPGNILQVRGEGGHITNVTVVRLGGGDYEGPASPILKIVALAAREEPIPESLDLQQKFEFNQTSILDNGSELDDQPKKSKKPNQINRIGFAQQVAVLAALQKQREAGNRYDTHETLAKVIQEIVGFKFTKGNLEGIREEMLALPPEQGGFDVGLELIVSKSPRHNAEPKQDLKARLAAVEMAMKDLPAMIAKLQEQVNKLTQANMQERGKLE